MSARGLLVVLLLLLNRAGTARADEELAERLKAIEARILDLEEQNSALRKQLRKPAAPTISSFSLMDGLRLRLGGYADLGFFKAMGDGVAYIRDDGKQLHPEFEDIPWVFVGDPWANPINSQGDSADLGLDRTNIPRYDPIQSRGRPSFIANLFNLNLLASLGEQLMLEASLNFEVRMGRFGSTGDVIDVDLLYLEWRPLPGRDLHVYLGKFESTFGIEYRNRKAPDRFGVTPSLIARYTTGTPTGLKVRGSLFDGALTLNLALTNGAMATERFAHLFNEIDSNNFKTVSGRLSLGRRFTTAVPLFIEAGASALIGAQDGQPYDDVYHWQAGADLRLSVGDFNLRGEFLRAVANRDRRPGVAWLDVWGMYAEATYQILPWLGVLGRWDLRKAQLFAETNLYLTDEGRITAGVRLDLHFNVIAKVEYLHLIELSGPELNDDVFTSSVILRF